MGRGNLSRNNPGDKKCLRPKKKGNDDLLSVFWLYLGTSGVKGGSFLWVDIKR